MRNNLIDTDVVLDWCRCERPTMKYETVVFARKIHSYNTYFEVLETYYKVITVNENGVVFQYTKFSNEERYRVR